LEVEQIEKKNLLVRSMEGVRILMTKMEPLKCNPTNQQYDLNVALRFLIVPCVVSFQLFKVNSLTLGVILGFRPS